MNYYFLIIDELLLQLFIFILYMSAPKTIFYMYGRFQPFTLGHNSLYEK